jgi:hypothetical protein
MLLQPASLSTQWFHLELAFGPAVDRMRHQDPDAKIDWDETEHYVRIGALAVACALLEDAGLRDKNEHVRVLFEIRNALIHNDGDISRNRNRRALPMAEAYLAASTHTQLSDQLGEPFFAVSGTKVRLLSGLNYALRLCML